MQPGPSAPLVPVDPSSTDPTDWTAGRLLSAAARKVERAWNAHLAGWDLNHASLPVLLHLLAGPRSQREIAARVGVTEQTMSRTILRLERTGLITRSLHPTDRRRVDVAITADGRRAALEAADVPRAEQILADVLTAEQLADLRALLLLVLTQDEHAPGSAEG
jgi:DNA-binding MarR family transcriptional regulator